ncbi:putative bifunctional diguanylate cyclase/phosphodiesterase [Gulbenkiania mobilis]|uniref:putative bifunctional diguanylate cyclase/phosphodiesterase n=1 Tax=Gulbenkiania mobilis TaxID=397457 RepID=UPI0006BBAB2C|nr:EAL domain-containing protein [Gulbenkiania mobilis]
MTPVYLPWVVMLSYAVAVLASYTALTLAGRLGRSNLVSERLWLVGGAVVLGTGIWAMHFTGMLAMRLPIPVGYDFTHTLLSWLLAVSASALAMWVLRRRRVPGWALALAGGLTGLGIAGMHYVGMLGMRMQPMIRYVPWLVVLSVVVAVAASLLALWLGLRVRQTTLPSRMMRLGGALLLGLGIAGMHYLGMAAARFAPDAVCGASNLIDQNVLVVLVGGGGLTLLTLAWLVAVLDARLESKTARLVDSLQTATAELIHLSNRDALTGLPNRRAFENRMQELTALGVPVTVAFVDLDGFKPVNDSLGHQVGDEVLTEVARRLAALEYPNLMPARIGGDEFVLLVTGEFDRTVLLREADSLIARVREPIQVGRHVVELSCSIGIASAPEHTRTLSRLITLADAAMYEAKRSGKNQALFYSPQMDIGSADLIDQQRDLRRAIGMGEFVLYYQPKVEIATGRVSGVEALVRWMHPDKGVVGPASFIPLMERFGLISDLGRIVLDLALADLKRWQGMGLSLPVSINLSPQQFRREGLAEGIIAHVEGSGIDPAVFTLEITETMAMDDDARTLNTLATLRAAGMRVSLDDFGTGYSSLSVLRDLAPEEVKIDRSFVRDIEHSRPAREMVTAMVAMGQALGMKVVAEGVESAGQVAILRNTGCDQVQGYFYSMPLPAADLVMWLDRQAPSGALLPHGPDATVSSP